MNGPRSLLARASFRLGLSVLAFCISVGGLGYFFYWATAGFIDRQAAINVAADLNGLMDSYRANGLIGLVNSINRRADPSANDSGVYLLENQMGVTIAGNVRSWPPKVEDKDSWLNFTISDLRTPKRIVAVRAKQYLLPEGGRLLVGRDIGDTRLLLPLYVGLAFGLILSGFAGCLLGQALSRRTNSAPTAS